MREIARKLFVTLNHCKVDHAYFVLCDGNFREKFYAESDEEAKAYFNGSSCYGCKYFEACGDSERKEKCEGRESK